MKGTTMKRILAALSFTLLATPAFAFYGKPVEGATEGRVVRSAPAAQEANGAALERFWRESEAATRVAH
jgi:hypothetical protein